MGTQARPLVTRIVLVDDHPMWIEGLRSAIESDPRHAVVGVAQTGRDGFRSVCSLRPDLVVLDINLPDVSGFEVAARIARDLPSVEILMLTMQDDVDTAFECLRAGARGYLLKGSRPESILGTIDVVSRGHAVLDSQISTRLLDHLISAGSREEAFPELTARERAVLELMADGRKNASIAVELGLSLKTVRNYVSRIFVKIQAADRAEAVVMARRAGLGR